MAAHRSYLNTGPINHGKGSKDRIVPFPNAFTEVLAVHIESAKKNKTVYLFESSWKKPYSDRGIRKILMNYTKEAGIENSISPHKLRHFLFTWMKKKGVDDALIQPYSGHDSRQSLEIYSKLSLVDCQPEYEKKIKEFPV
ncbi:tyrosine-type recombinase/integrase [Candidatus Tisiphia endosymbiont of Nemotelus uliginosus]|uniref:tyrosine-type recombinase/integrase n=1 Tax=Candidatus Tisiphia endosymbiont of Nemotelus uliginosus TaxID=3077926 RepID=UPI0035C8A348